MFDIENSKKLDFVIEISNIEELKYCEYFFNIPNLYDLYDIYKKLYVFFDEKYKYGGYHHFKQNININIERIYISADILLLKEKLKRIKEYTINV